VCLDIYVAGRPVGQVLANRYREDLRAAGLGNGHHGFEFALSRTLACVPDGVEVRRSLDGAILQRTERCETLLRRLKAAS
jgi:hypothetical protein